MVAQASSRDAKADTRWLIQPNPAFRPKCRDALHKTFAVIPLERIGNMTCIYSSNQPFVSLNVVFTRQLAGQNHSDESNLGSLWQRHDCLGLDLYQTNPKNRSPFLKKSDGRTEACVVPTPKVRNNNSSRFGKWILDLIACLYKVLSKSRDVNGESRDDGF